MNLTIITATRNSAATIERCLRTIPSFKPSDDHRVEILLIDGASQDGTVELAIAACPNLKFETQTSKGLYQALNEAVSKAGGDYIMFLHSDDELAGIDLDAIFFDPKTVVYGAVEFIDEKGNVLFRRRPPLFPKRCLSQYPFIFHPNAIYPKWLLLKYPFDGDKYGTAADMWQINAFRDEVKFVPTTAITYRFRIHTQSTTVKNLKRKFGAPFWMWRIYLFLFFEDHRTARVMKLLHGKRTWS